MSEKRLSRDELNVQLNLKLIESLRSSEEKYRKLVDNLNQIVFQLNAEGLFVFVNNTWEISTGIACGDTLNKSWLSFIDLQDRHLAEQHFSQVFQKDSATRFECRLDINKPQQMVVEVCLSPLPGIKEYEGLIGTFFDITNLKQTLQAISDSNSRLSWALQGAKDGYWDWNVETNYVFFSPRWKTMLGFTADYPLRPHLDTWRELVHPDDRDRTLATANQYLSGQADTFEVEFRIRHTNGSWIDILSRASMALDDKAKLVSPKRLVGTHVDISERKKVELQLKLLETALEASANSIIITNIDGTIEWVNPAFTQLTGYSAQEVLGCNPREIIFSGVQGKAFYKDMWETIMSNKVWKGDLVNKRKDGTLFNDYMTITPVSDKSGEIIRFIAIKEDITQRKAAEKEIHDLAFYDPLTKLPNRRLLMECLKQVLKDCNRDQSYAALLFIDLDNFKKLNDTHGHDYGDLLLIETAQRLNACVRNNDTVARLGGDEFVIMIKQLGNNERKAIAAVQNIGKNILQSLNQVYILVNIEHHSSSSIGICMFMNQFNDAGEVLRRADTAMYEAKASGRNALRFFDPVMQQNLMHRMQLETELWKALEEEQFQLYYQLQVDQQQMAIGAEALIRWQHPERGIMTPDLFLEQAEAIGILPEIGNWVINTGLKQLRNWQINEQTKHFSLSLNVSATQFQKPEFVKELKKSIFQNKVNCQGLILELTESTLIDDIDNTIAKINELKTIGIRISMDDFGTGYSSLSYLKRFKLSQLKIDRMFVRDLQSSEDDLVLVKAIINMGNSLDLDVVAEGVENLQQFKILKQNHCAKFQGYHFSKPLPIDEINIL